jgi:hypothetical protein
MKMINSKKGVSEIVVTIILIGIGIGAVAVVGALVNNMLSGKMKETTSCSGIYDQVKINKEYTCYTGNDITKKYNLTFSIGLGDIEIEGLKIAIKANGTVKSFDLNNDPKIFSGIQMSNGTTSVYIPKSNEGFSYLITNLDYAPDSIAIAPVREGKVCQESDSMVEIVSCTYSRYN